MAVVAYTVIDEHGAETMLEASGEGVNLDVCAFVDLDDGRRILAESGALGIGAASVSSHEMLEAEMRDYVFEDEIREVAETDEDVAEMLGELEDLVGVLAEAGIEAHHAFLRGLPFTVEADVAVRERLGL